jgi:hypothetical protein
MKEFNKKTLIEALSSMPEHEPPDDLWVNLEAQMQDDLPHSLFQQLPTYDPPQHLWKNISQQLDPKGRGEARLIPMRWKRALAVAASLLAITFAIWLFQAKQAEPIAFTVSHTTETVDDLLLENDWDEDEEAFRHFIEICEAKKYICEQPEFKQLQTELNELTQAKEELTAALGDFSSNPELIAQIKEIELERTDVLKKMMIMLI